MKTCEVLYAVCDVASNGDWVPMGPMYPSRTGAEEELRSFRSTGEGSPSMFVVRMVLTRCHKTRSPQGLAVV